MCFGLKIKGSITEQSDLAPNSNFLQNSPSLVQEPVAIDITSKKDQIFMMNFDFMKNYTKYFSHNNPDGVIFKMSLRLKRSNLKKKTINFSGGSALKMFNLSALKMALQQQSPLLDGLSSPKKGGTASKILDSPSKLLKRAFTKKNFFQSD